MYQTKLKTLPGTVVHLPNTDDMEESHHVMDLDSIRAVNAALVSGRPLLVRGEPGMGKSQLARAAARELGRVLIRHTVDARTETRDLLWTVDGVARLAEAQVLGAFCQGKLEEVQERIAIDNFVHPGPLWWAFEWNTALVQAKRVHIDPPPQPSDWDEADGSVVLIDEIDKADPSIPNGLLDALGHRRFDIPGGKRVRMKEGQPPLVVITTNEERALPDAFLRRCWVLHLTLPKERTKLMSELKLRGNAHFGGCNDALLTQAADLVVTYRDKAEKQHRAPPGVAEYIDLLHVVTELSDDPDRQVTLLDEFAKFALQKHPTDV
ncbi:MAG: MoxR family ATPase [Polyangiaceae bacterium]|nr:MoxR family ATPase [Polyangiaceae bacterium]